MFDTGAMTLVADTRFDEIGEPDTQGNDALSGGTQGDVVRELQARIRRMQRNKLDTRELPTNPALADLLPGGALAAGSAYSVPDSTTLALALLQGPSAAGAWCAVVGMPDLGIEAAAGLGIDLDRLVLVPHPGDQWLTVASALVDVVSVLLVRPQLRDGRVRITDGTASKLASRLRQREAVLISLGDWPGADARLTVTDSSWAGLGSGFGHLTGRQVTVSSTAARWQGRAKSRRLWLPGPDQSVSPVTTRAEPRILHEAAG
jgi:membrane protein implicated in regulation of membrane protease activity